MAHRSFSPAPGGEPVTFDFGDGEEFVAVPRAPAALFLDMADIATRSAGERVHAVAEFLDLVVTPESRERLTVRMRDPLRPVDLEQLVDVVKWLIEVYAGRPTEPDSPSSDGQPETLDIGTPSTGTAPGGVLTL